MEFCRFKLSEKITMIQIKDKHNCCGCTACASVCGRKAIKMIPDEEGFLYPIIDLSRCTDCHLCEQVCPMVQRYSNQNHHFTQKILAVHNKNTELLYKSSSGGAFTAIAENALAKNGIIYGVEYNKNHVVVHCKEDSIYGIAKFRGSKYVQSQIVDIYNDIKTQLRLGKKVLFSGTPCQTEGLKLFLGKSYDNLTTVDILCHGVASPQIFSDYVNFIKKHSVGHLKKMFMKDKTFGWGYQENRLYFYEGSTEFNTPLSRLWNQIYYDHICIRPSCHQCRFTNFHRPGDITLGDFWGIEKHHKDFYSTLGVSLFIINTQKGEELWENIKNKFDYIKSNANECMQPVLQYPQPESVDRKQFWLDYKKKGFDKVIQQRYNISNRILLKNYINQIKNIILQK